jgi:pimeloyl-ACP methyl ester carboxylesterase
VRLRVPFADAHGVRLYYEVHGQGEPLLLHPGFGSTVPVYWANTAALARHFQVIVFDPRGSGRSGVPEGACTMQDFANDAAALLDAAGVESAHVFGTSFGGMVAQHLAIEHPRRVRRLVLGCTTAGGTRHVLPPGDNVVRFLGAAENPDPVAAVRATYFMHYSDEYAASHDAEIVARSLANEHLRSTPQGRAGQLAAVQGHDTHDRLREIAAPTLVLHGAGDGMVPVENGRMLAAAIPNARLIIYQRGRHIFFAECAAQLNADIVAFLKADEGDLLAK